MKGWYPTGAPDAAHAFTPSAALLKATLINGAREMTGDGAYLNGESRYPNDNQGFGRVNLDDAMYFQGDARVLSLGDNRVGLGTGGSSNYDMAIGDTRLPVEVTLVWTDYPATVGCGVCLVNDLDLTVTAPDGTVYRGNQYSGYNPGESTRNPTDTDHTNNVESVLVITGVQTGLWTVSITGTDVPQGPQSYALVMTGGIATERGVVRLDKNRYQSNAIADITVIDTDLNLDPGSPDTAQANVTSNTETDPEVVTLTETGNATSVFAGSIQLQNNPVPTPGDGLLQVQNGDTITATYFDANDGSGGSGPTSDTAIVDDTPPVISGTAVTELRFNRAMIGWTTDEPSNSVIVWNTATPPAANSESSSILVTDHALTLQDLTDNTTYYFYVQSTDEAGNTATDDNSSSYYSFTTPPRPPTAPASPEWPTFQNNPQRQGLSPSVFDPPLKLRWQDGPYTNSLWSSPILGGGTLYETTWDGHMRARDPLDGTILWDRQLGYATRTGTPSYDNGVLYIAFLDTSFQDRLYAINATTGDTIWSVTSSVGVDPNPNLPLLAVDGLVFGLAYGGEMFALNEADGSLKWSYDTGDYPWGGIAVAGGIAYAGTTGFFTSPAVFAVDEFTGAFLWSAGVDDTIATPPLVVAGAVFAGTYSGTMYSFDAATGSLLWSTGGFGLIDLS